MTATASEQASRDWPFSPAVLEAFDETYRDDCAKAEAAPWLEEALSVVEGIHGVDEAAAALGVLADRLEARASARRGDPEWGNIALAMGFVRTARKNTWDLDGAMSLRVPHEERLEMARKGEWPCKIGTMPAVLHIHGKDVERISPGERIRVRDKGERRWHEVIVRRLAGGADPWFQADRI